MKVQEHYFAELVPGLEAFGRAELERLGARNITRAGDGVRFDSGDVKRVRKARTVAALYLSLSFDVPRPKALLGDQAFKRLTEAVRRVAGEHGRGSALSGGPFDGLRLAAAGSDSAVMQRLGNELANAAGLGYDPEDGELLVRLRPEPRGTGWEALVRLTPRPASAREWRVCNRAGGLNAAVAAAMNELVGMKASDRYLNLMCGSGTLLVERALVGPARRMVGVDVDPAALVCAERNLQAAGVADQVELLAANVAELEDGTGPFDVIVADAPWGDAIGGKASNRDLYPTLLERAAALAAPRARFALLTHEVKLARRLVAASEEWAQKRELQVAHGGHNPLLLLLERR